MLHCSDLYYQSSLTKANPPIHAPYSSLISDGYLPNTNLIMVPCILPSSSPFFFSSSALTEDKTKIEPGLTSKLALVLGYEPSE